MLKYYLKKYINKLFKGIHNLFLFFGISVSFVKKKNGKSALEHNSLEDANAAYSSKEYQAEILSTSHQQFFLKLIGFIISKEIALTGKTVADFGCGAGNILWHIKQRFPTAILYGYDFSEKAIEIAKKRVPDAFLATHDLYSTTDKKYDIVFCTEVLEHLLYPGKALKNLIDMTRNGGTVIVTVPDGRVDNYEGHINFWSPESWKVFIESQSERCKAETGYLSGTMMYALISVT